MDHLGLDPTYVETKVKEENPEIKMEFEDPFEPIVKIETEDEPFETNEIIDHQPKKYKCVECSKILPTELKLMNHIQKFHQINGTKLRKKRKYSCEHCDKNFSSKSYKNTHVKTKHMKMHLPCKTCRKSFNSIQALNYHMMKNHGSNEGLDQTVWEHDVSDETNEPIMDQSNCEIGEFIDERSEFIDENTEFIGENTELIGEDTEFIGERSELIDEKSEVHEITIDENLETEEPFNEMKICPFCQEVFSSIELKSHIGKKHLDFLLQSDEEKNATNDDQCSTALVPTEHVDQVEFHQKTLKTKKHQCKHCSRRYTYKNCLTSHVKRIHSGPRKRHNCEVCQRKFNSKQALRYHMKVNHNLSNNLKVNTAKVVLKRLSQQTVKKYQKLEVDEENVCEMCNASFTTPMTLSKHIKLVHVEKELNKLKQLMKLNNDYKQVTMQMKNQLLQFCKSHNL